MKRLIFHIALFVFPIVAFVLFFPLEREQLFIGLKNDCASRGYWIYERLYKDSTPVDFAFIGSSKTMNAIDESIIEKEFEDLNVLNFGYCRYGRNLHYHFSRELIAEKNINYLVLEVRYEENPYSHPIFPYIASTGDLLTAYPFFNKDWFSDWSTAFRYRLQLLQEELWKSTSPGLPTGKQYGYIINPNTADTTALTNAAHERNLLTQSSEIKENFENIYPLYYLSRIVDICKENQVKVYFLYLPNYGMPSTGPKKPGFYLQNGTLLIPPPDILNEKSNWGDPNHLNEIGARKISYWLAEELLKADSLQ